eukprot:jgi/Chlat1/438/Chrsp103S01012
MAKEFGSKADMLSTRIDEVCKGFAVKLCWVSRNSIWREHCQKELRSTHLHTDFSLTRPDRMSILPEKPNKTTPSDLVGANVESAVAELESLCTVKLSHAPPNERLQLPLTSSHEYGWHNKQVLGKNSMFNRAKESCDITRYADKYYHMMGATPFTAKNKNDGSRG